MCAKSCKTCTPSAPPKIEEPKNASGSASNGGSASAKNNMANEIAAKKSAERDQKAKIQESKSKESAAKAKESKSKESAAKANEKSQKQQEAAVKEQRIKSEKAAKATAAKQGGCLYPKSPGAGCDDFCSWESMKGPSKCMYRQFSACSDCCTACRDRFSSCQAWVGGYGCDVQISVNGEAAKALKEHCKKSCGV